MEEHAAIACHKRGNVCLCCAKERLQHVLFGVFYRHACVFAQGSHLKSVFPREYLAGLAKRPSPASDPRDTLVRISHPAISHPRIAFAPSDVGIRPSWQNHSCRGSRRYLRTAHLPKDLELARARVFSLPVSRLTTCSLQQKRWAGELKKSAASSRHNVITRNVGDRMRSD